MSVSKLCFIPPIVPCAKDISDERVSNKPSKQSFLKNRIDNIKGLNVQLLGRRELLGRRARLARDRTLAAAKLRNFVIFVKESSLSH